MELPYGASVSAEEIKKIKDGLEALAKDPHAPRETTLRVTLHVHNDFPMILYRGKETKSVANYSEAEAAGREGFGVYDHEAYTAVEK